MLSSLKFRDIKVKYVKSHLKALATSFKTRAYTTKNLGKNDSSFELENLILNQSSV